MATLARHTFTVTDQAGNIMPGAWIEVRSETIGGTPLASLYSDRAGTAAIGNPFQADAITGVAFFHAVGDAYKVRAYTGPSGAPTSEQFFRYESVGTAAEYDHDALFTSLADGTAGAPSLAFASDPDTGIYRIGANNFGLAAGGSKIIDIATSLVSITQALAVAGAVALASTLAIASTTDATSSVSTASFKTLGGGAIAKSLWVGTTFNAVGVGSFGDGLVGTPGIAFGSDLDNGAYRIGTNNWGLVAGGSKIVDIATTGIVVTGALTVNGTGHGASEIVAGFRDSAMVATDGILIRVGRDESNYNAATLAFQYTGTGSTANYGWLGLYAQDRTIRWDGQGFVGIGTGTTALTKLFQVGSSLQFGVDGSGNISTSGTFASSNATSGISTTVAAVTAKSLGLTENLFIGGTVTAKGPLIVTPAVAGAPASSGTTQAALIQRFATNPGGGLVNVLDIGGYGSGSYAMWLQVGNSGGLGPGLPLSLQPLGTSGGGDGVGIGLGSSVPSAMLHVNGTFLGVGAGNFSSTLSVAGLLTASAGFKASPGPFTWGGFATTTGTTMALGANDTGQIWNGSGTGTCTLPSAASNPGRWIYLKSICGFALNSASSNVAPITSSTAGTAILAATAGKWAWLQSDGISTWHIMAAN